ncbi:PP2C family protein-serine/threonine phosphatase [uncultured Roseovarius sp.]|uniref:PP2C family protein-serine/threonine phosphatase n=1 Tax=Roseovarius sp. TaxID=1486281 RepID=UPI0025DC57F3|nr:protein phosphatase 2C domain-containing protein [uncultured Roseovarius sp.]
MLPTAELVYDTSMAMVLGRRERQEDAVVSDFSSGEAFGFVVLADGMGGHAAGDVASKIVVTEVFSKLKLQSGDPEILEPQIGEVLEKAAVSANKRVGMYARERPEAHGMGATLLAPVFIHDRLYWISVGDSPLYLFRNGVLERLNENHALMSQIDYLVANGIMGREEALNYPDQTCLTSVLIGREIAQLDCRTVPVQIQEGDILIVASDGLQFLCEDQIEGVLRFTQKRSAEDIGAALMKEVQKLDDPCQDNVSLCVVKVLGQGAGAVVTDQDQIVSRTQNYNNASITIMAKVTRKKKATG